MLFLKCKYLFINLNRASSGIICWLVVFYLYMTYCGTGFIGQLVIVVDLGIFKNLK